MTYFSKSISLATFVALLFVSLVWMSSTALAENNVSANQLRSGTWVTNHGSWSNHLRLHVDADGSVTGAFMWRTVSGQLPMQTDILVGNFDESSRVLTLERRVPKGYKDTNGILRGILSEDGAEILNLRYYRVKENGPYTQTRTAPKTISVEDIDKSTDYTLWSARWYKPLEEGEREMQDSIDKNYGLR